PQLVVSFIREGVTAAELETPGEPPIESDHQSIIGAIVPGPKCLDWPCCERWQESTAGGTRAKRGIGLADAQQIVHDPVIIVRFDHVILDLLLHTDANTSCEWSLETAVDVSGE